MTKRIKISLEPVTKIWAKCRKCVEFRHNFGDSFCVHKGYWFEARHIDTGEKVDRKMINHHAIAYCRKCVDKYPQQEVFSGKRYK